MARNGFVWDDDSHITANRLLVEPGGLSRIWTSAESMQYYPATFTVFWAAHKVWGFDPRGYHFLNLFLHLVDALWLGLLLRRLKVPGAEWAALLFAVHPVQAETVAWATELKNVLCLFFFLGALDRWLAFERDASARDYGLSLAAYAACLLSKTAACLFPAVVAVLVWARGGRLDRKAAVRLAPFFALGGASAVVTVLYERYRNGADPAFALSLAQRPVLAGQALWFYLGKLLLPADLSFVYRRWPLDPGSAEQWVPLLAAVGVFVALWRGRARFGRAPFAAAAIFGLLLFPVLGFFDVFFMRFSFVADHFQYFAAMAVLALIPAAVDRAFHSSALKRAALVALVGLFAAATYRRAEAFRDSTTLWRDTVAKNPSAWMAWDNLAVEDLAAQRWADAEEHARRALELSPNYGLGYFHAGLAQWNQGKFDESAANLTRSLAVDPRYLSAVGPRVAIARSYLGLHAARARKPAEALEQFALAAEAGPAMPFTQFNYARALLGAGRKAEAERPCLRGLALEPDSAAGDACRRAFGTAPRP